MNAPITKGQLPSIQLLGFIVSGHRGDPASNSNATLVAVLAESQEAAFEVASAADVLFRPAGSIQESDLKEQLGIIAKLRAQNPLTKDLGFLVGGYVGDLPTDAGSGMIAILAISSDAAIVQSVEIQPDFHPTGCLSESDLKKFTGAIDRLRLKPPGMTA